MFLIFQILSPIFLTIFLGYFIVARNILSKDQIKVLGLFVIRLAVPCLLVVSISAQNLASLWQPQYLLSYGLVSLLIFALILLLYFKVFKTPLSQASVFALGASMSNTGFMGGAILHSVLGANAAIYFAITFLLENFIVFLPFLICLEIGQQQQANFKTILLQTLKNIMRNPIILALILGVSMSALQLQFPKFIFDVLMPIGKIAAPLGLFVVGGSLYGIKKINNISRDASIIISTKLVAMPLLVYLVFLCLPNTTPEMIFAGVLLASMSMATLFGVFAQGLGMGERSSTILLITTIGTILSTSTVIMLLHPM